MVHQRFGLEQLVDRNVEKAFSNADHFALESARSARWGLLIVDFSIREENL